MPSQKIQRKKFPHLLLILIISTLPVLYFLFAQDLFHTHDGLVHLPRIGAYFNALKDGQILPRWAGDLNYGYGMPLFNFIYHTPYLVSSLFLFLGTNLVWSFKLSVVLSFFLSGIFMYLFAKELFQDEKKAFIVTLLYQFTPFHLVELLIRGSFGEIYTYAFLPLVLFCVLLLGKKRSILNFVLTILAVFLLIISHNSISLVYFFMALVFVILFIPTFKSKTIVFSAFALGLILSAFYWFPAVFEHQYTFGDLYMRDLYKSHFAPIWYFLIPNILKSKQLEIGAVSVQFGLFNILAIALSIFSYRKTKDLIIKRLIVFCIACMAVSLFFMQPVSKFLWQNLSLLRQFQFPWRFLSVVVFASSMLGFSFLDFKIFTKKNAYIVLCILIVITTIAYWKPAEGIDKINESYYWNFPLNTTYYGETDVIWSAGAFKKYPKSPVELISGEANISSYKRLSYKHTFTVDSKTDNVRIVDHTQYFPDWRVFVDGKQVDIQFQDPSWRGEITFFVPKGKHDVTVIFQKNMFRLILRTLNNLIR